MPYWDHSTTIPNAKPSSRCREAPSSHLYFQRNVIRSEKKYSVEQSYCAVVKNKQMKNRQLIKQCPQPPILKISMKNKTRTFSARNHLTNKIEIKFFRSITSLQQIHFFFGVAIHSRLHTSSSHDRQTNNKFPSDKEKAFTSLILCRLLFLRSEASINLARIHRMNENVTVSYVKLISFWSTMWQLSATE